MVTRRLGKTNDRRQVVLEARKKELTTDYLNKRVLKLVEEGKLTKTDALKKRNERIDKEIKVLEERIRYNKH